MMQALEKEKDYHITVIHSTTAHLDGTPLVLGVGTSLVGQYELTATDGDLCFYVLPWGYLYLQPDAVEITL